MQILINNFYLCEEHPTWTNGNNPQFALFNSSGFFTVPCGVYRVRALVVGAGGGGGSGAAGGGAAGYVRSGVLEVEPHVVVKITVGRGGKGSTTKGDCRQDSQSGGRSSFGGFLYADGGSSHKGTCFDNRHGASGGSGGGESCTNFMGYCRSGAGGSRGSNGNIAARGQSFGRGRGQGDYMEQLRSFRGSLFTAGAGGKGRLSAASGGGGGGGILVNCWGPSAGDGEVPIGAQGGRGFGAGGGSGFLDSNEENSSQLFHSGGDGADGVVYVEWGFDSNYSSALNQQLNTRMTYTVIDLYQYKLHF